MTGELSFDREHVPSPREVRKSGVSLEDALQEQVERGHGMLAKPEERDALLEKLPISEEEKQLLRSYKQNGKDQGHLVRLLSSGRSPAEQKFGSAYLHHVGEVFPDLQSITEDDVKERIADERQVSPEDVSDDDVNDWVDTWLQVKELIGNEGADTTMWWTYAPYLFEELKKGGVEDRDALQRIFSWAKDAVERAPENKKKDRVYLRGLQFLVGENERNTYILSNDPNGLSHRFTEAMAQEMIDRSVV